MFQRGDVEFNRMINVSDAIRILVFLFVSDHADILDCQDAADIDDSGSIEITDAIGLLTWLFLGGLLPPSPFREPGPDLTPDELDCLRVTG